MRTKWNKFRSGTFKWLRAARALLTGEKSDA